VRIFGRRIFTHNLNQYIMASNTGQTLLALLTGAAIGGAIGILYAPDSGKKTRAKISKEATKAQKQLTKQLKETQEALGAKAKDTKHTLEQNLENTLSSASYKADDVLAALENKLDTLRKQNAKLQKETATSKIDTASKKATS
jgi:gas vesicle protein